MKKSKKGFTIVELVIVIAVIAILAAVLIPTFSGVIDKANKSADLQKARSNLSMLLADDGLKGDLANFSSATNKHGFDISGSGDALIFVGKNYTFTYKIAEGEWDEGVKNK